MALPAGTYHYVAMYEYADHRGRICRGVPSPDWEVDSDGVAAVLTFMVGGHPQPGYDRGRLKCVLYRSTVNPASPIVYYRHTERSSTVASVINDSRADADLIDNEILYTVGGELPNYGPPPALAIVPWKNRVVALHAETGAVWPSKPMLDDEWPGFHEGLSVSTRIHRTKPLFLSAMDDKLIVWWRDAIGIMYGEAADATGNGRSLTEPTIIHRGMGLRSPRSVLHTPAGIFFQSLNGICLLTADLQVQPIGLPVSVVTTAPVCIGASYLHFNNYDGDQKIGRVARFAFDSTIMYDYSLDRGTWSAVVAAMPGSNVAGMATHLGRCAIAGSGATGRVWVATDAGTTDPGSIAIATDWRSRWVKPAGVLGEARIHSIMLLGRFPATTTIDVFYNLEGTAGDSKVLTGIGTDTESQVIEVRVSRQRCHAFSVRVQGARRIIACKAEVSGDTTATFRQNAARV